MAQTWRKSFEILKTLFALPSAVWLLGLVSFFNDSASEQVYLLVPLYLSLGADGRLQGAGHYRRFC
jgi:hypothetical protein